MNENPAPTLWAQGNYENVAVHFGSAAAKAIEAAGIESGLTVLDVACGRATRRSRRLRPERR
jgi:hypothetical protein